MIVYSMTYSLSKAGKRGGGPAAIQREKPAGIVINAYKKESPREMSRFRYYNRFTKPGDFDDQYSVRDIYLAMTTWAGL